MRWLCNWEEFLGPAEKTLGGLLGREPAIGSRSMNAGLARALVVTLMPFIGADQYVKQCLKMQTGSLGVRCTATTVNMKNPIRGT